MTLPGVKTIVRDTFGIMTKADMPKKLLSRIDLEAILSEISYRPGWEFRLYDDEYEGLHIKILTTQLNSYDTDTTTDLGVNSPLPPFETMEEFLRWLGWRLRRIESHECREFFKYRGKVVSNPHGLS